MKRVSGITKHKVMFFADKIRPRYRNSTADSEPNAQACKSAWSFFGIIPNPDRQILNKEILDLISIVISIKVLKLIHGRKDFL